MKPKVSMQSTAGLLMVVLLLAPAVPAERDPGAPVDAGQVTVIDGGEHEAQRLRSPADVTLLPGVPGLHLGGEDEPDGGGVNEALLIKMTYRAIATAVRKSGHHVRFELSDFTTHYAEDFPSLMLADVVSYAPMVLEIDYTEVSRERDGGVELLGASFVPQWRPLDETMVPEDPDWGKLTYDEILRIAASDRAGDEDLGDVVAVTTYGVVVSHRERSEAYRAAFIWLADDGGAVRFRPHDQVTLGVEEIWGLSRRAAPLAALDRGIPAPNGEDHDE